MSLMLERLAGLMGLCFLCCLLAGGARSVPLCAALLTAAYLSFGSLTAARPVRRPDAGLLALFCLLVRLLLNAAAPAAAAAGGTCLCIALTALLSLTLAPRRSRLTLAGLLPLLLTALAAFALEVIAALTLLPAALLPMSFGLICGSLGGLLILFLQR
ncbi:MAG: hypothetical protein IJ343_04740, partial [Clostridia bacterium]|nr:hypothetical protein [Clostridia bacterium]